MAFVFFFFFQYLVVAATDGECEQNTLKRHILSCFRACLILSHMTLAQGVVRVIPFMCHAPVCLIFLQPSLFALSICLFTSPSMWIGSEFNPVRFRD